jgi:hypothetical protein
MVTGIGQKERIVLHPELLPLFSSQGAKQGQKGNGKFLPVMKAGSP